MAANSQDAFFFGTLPLVNLKTLVGQINKDIYTLTSICEKNPAGAASACRNQMKYQKISQHMAKKGKTTHSATVQGSIKKLKQDSRKLEDENVCSGAKWKNTKMVQHIGHSFEAAVSLCWHQPFSKYICTHEIKTNTQSKCLWNSSYGKFNPTSSAPVCSWKGLNVE